MKTHKPRLLDLCCKSGGASKGYADAGFDVTGLDIEPQPKYPFRFIQAEALEYLATADLSEYSVIAASPHCQGYKKRGAHMKRKDGSERPKQIDQFRAMLESIGLPYVIENVVDAPLLNEPLFGPQTIMLCGTMFGLSTPNGAELQRHRKFETNWPCPLPPPAVMDGRESLASMAATREIGDGL